MSYIVVKIDKMSMDFGQEELLNIDSLTLYTGERVAIVGDNGSGKSTLLKLLLGELTPSEGRIETYSDMSYLPQVQSEKELVEVYQRYNIENRRNLLSKNKGSHSGGERTLDGILATIGENKPTLLLDEPTTFLDRRGVKDVISLLDQEYRTMVFVSHNTEFINGLADKIWYIEDKTVKEYYGNYTDFIRCRELEEKELEHKVKKYHDTKKHLEDVIHKKSKQAAKSVKVSAKQKNKNIKPSRLSGTKQKDSVQKSINKSMKAAAKKMEMLEEVAISKQKRKVVYPDIQFIEQHSRFPVLISDFTLKVEDRVLLSDISLQVKNGTKVCITGDNGSGKTTLLNHIYNRGEGVEVATTSKIQYFGQKDSVIYGAGSILGIAKGLDNMPDKYINAVLINLGFEYSDLRRQITTLSGGELVRFKLALVFLQKSNMLFLDEPTTFLDIETRKSLSKMIVDYPGTVLFVSHDQEFIDDTADEIYDVSDGQLCLVE
jgi:macrolide transport system ATP-binding/permease protein